MLSDCKFQFVMHHCKPLPYQAHNHTHDCYEVVYYITGTGISRIDGVDYPYSDGTFCIIPPHTRHAEFAETQTNLVYIGFDYSNPGAPLNAGLFSDASGDVLEIMDHIKTEMVACPAYFDDMLAVETGRLVLTLLRMTTTAEHTKSEDTANLFDYAVQFIEINYMKEIDIEALAQSVGYSYHRFRHLFSQIYHLTPRQFIQKVRISKAEQLLRTSDDSVAQISSACGFNFCPQFIAAFREAVGQTPLQYRKHANEIAHYVQKN